MKRLPFYRRLAFAWRGLKVARREPNFRIQLFLGAAACGLFAFLQASPLWWAVLSLTIAGVLAAEAFNTAIEELSDHLHPFKDPAIARVKDCAAGAVLIVSFASLAVLGSFLWSRFGLGV